MSSRTWPHGATPRFVLWLALCALLLKAAVPLLATASAQAEGKALVEVCTVYGVATFTLDEPGPAPAPQHVAPHAGEHCALGAVLALAAPGGGSADFASWLDSEGAPFSAHGPLPATRDAVAVWAARLMHAPPARA